MKNCPICNEGKLKKGNTIQGVVIYKCFECGKEIPFSEDYSKMIQETDISMKK